MRPERLYLAISAVCLGARCSTTAAQRYAVLPREATTSANDAAAVSTIHPAASSASSDGMSSTSTTPAGPTSAAASTTTPLMSSTPIVKGSLNVSGTTTPKIEGLPIHPEITPALAVAGSILLLTGVLYTLVGIKTKWLHIFLSTAYIFALAVTILIEFVMHTPVSNAAQGAYVVAATVTGLIAGAGSLIFKDVMEGISCFLGGFCFSMWVLILRPGGTISNTTGKIIFISCLTVGAPALYISRRTRPYGLIGSTSFAGATVIVLGVDCFSRAGLKEFWLYIWNINNEIFPLHYNGPYPITRGTQVETGATIIICAMGIMSQMKVWKIIRGRKKEKASEQRRRDEERIMADEEHGRRIEDGIKRERGSWEAAYGSGEQGKSQQLDTGTGTDEPSTRKGSLSVHGAPDVRISNPEGIELQEMDGSSHVPEEGGKVIVHVMQDEGLSHAPSATGQNPARSIAESKEPSVRESLIDELNHSGLEASPHIAAVRSTVDQNLTLKPRFTPLPFKVPDSDFENEDGRSSVAASADSEHLVDRWSKRLSGSSIVRKLSKKSQRSFIAASTSEEALMIPETQIDRASSVAATVDGISEKGDSDEEALSVRDQRPSFEILRKQDSMQALIREQQPSSDSGNIAEKSPGQRVNETALSGQAEKVQHVDGSIAPQPESVPLPESEIASTIDAQSPIEDPNAESRANNAAGSEASEQRHRITSFSANLPAGASMVVTAYRTNEWAKHLDRADLPEIDDLKLKNSQAPDSLQPTERVAPVDVRALQQTSLSARPAPILTVQTHSLGEKPASSNRPKDPAHRPQDAEQHKSAVHHLIREKAMERTPSQTSLVNNIERSPSQTSLRSTQSRKEQSRPHPPKSRPSPSPVPSARGLRSSSTPIISSLLVESPIEEGVEASFPTRFTPSSTHLMSQRDSLLRNKPSSTSLLRTSWSNAALDQHPALRTLTEDDNISLSQRRSILQQNPQSVLQTRRSSSGPILGATTPVYPHDGASTTIHSRSRPSLTPPPLSGRPSPTPRESTISAWRTSLQNSATTHYRDQEIEAHRATLLAEKRRESTSRQEQTVTENITQHVKTRAMRQRSMIELHQQQMRKMQAEANRSLA